MKAVYERANVWGKGGHHIRQKEIPGKHAFKNFLQRQSNRKAIVTELIENNFEVGISKFITLTFGNETITKEEEGFEFKEIRFQEINECHNEFKKFIQRLRNLYPELKYVATIELQEKSGRRVFHYHMVCDLPYIEHSKLLKVWRNGSVWIENTTDIEKLSQYITKGFDKKILDHLNWKKGYLCSKGLRRDIVVRSWVAEENPVFLETKELLKDKKGVLVRKSTNKYAGTCEYTSYEVESKLF